jgi:hypothetical protein
VNFVGWNAFNYTSLSIDIHAQSPLVFPPIPPSTEGQWLDIGALPISMPILFTGILL